MADLRPKDRLRILMSVEGERAAALALPPTCHPHAVRDAERG